VSSPETDPTPNGAGDLDLGEARVEGLARRRGLDVSSPFVGVLLERLHGEDVGPPPDDGDVSDPSGAVARVQRALAAVAAGRIVLVVDDTDRENEGDLIQAADAASTESVAFMLRHTSGVVCVALPAERCDQLGLPVMVPDNDEPMGTAFTVTVDLRHGVTTGISAADRAATIRALGDPGTTAADLSRPGHVFPLRARRHGVLQRRGHTEAAVDLARLAGRTPAGVICEVVTDDRLDMARRPDLRRLAARFDLPYLSVGDIVDYRRATEGLVTRGASAALPTRYGGFRATSFTSTVDGAEHLALTYGDVTGDDVLVRLHSECLTGDALGSARCDCGDQLHEAMSRIAAEGRGVVVYLKGHEGRGIGLAAKIAAYELQDRGLDTVDANRALGHPIDARDYTVGAAMLRSLGVASVRLLTNNPHKVAALEAQGVEVGRVPIGSPLTEVNAGYLATKRNRLGHLPPA
jgi:3,4-dihydroxy 2-butanone 4-phosphate synthase / GTP cyclohydrolase II